MGLRSFVATSACGVWLLIAAALLTFGGCRSYTVLDRDLPALVGKDVQLLIRRLGYPDHQDVMLNEKVYTWHFMNQCTLHVAVDPTEHIIRSDYNGGRDDCGPMADRIDYDDREYRPARLNSSRSVAKATEGASQHVSYETNTAPRPTPVTQVIAPNVAGREIVVGRDLRAWFGPGGKGGMVVTEVEKNGPAARAGIHVGDVITAVDGQPTAGYGESASTLITNGEGDTVRLVVLSKK